MTDLKLTNWQYSVVLTITYVPYIVAELPLTLLIRKVCVVKHVPMLTVVVPTSSSPRSWSAGDSSPPSRALYTTMRVSWFHVSSLEQRRVLFFLRV